MRAFCSMYRLDGHEPVPEPDIELWAWWFTQCAADRIVARTQTAHAEISTVFTGIDASIRLDAPPVLFETMVFGGSSDGEMDRYHTWDAAEQGHATMVMTIRARELKQEEEP